MTWSILAFDETTGAFGAAVATKAFASGSFVPFVRAGVGAVGTQSLTNRYLAPVALDGLARGLTPALAISAAVAGDEGREIRHLLQLKIGKQWSRPALAWPRNSGFRPD